ncbi:MAG: hypothetical protein ACP5OU_07300 [Methanothrix sp.]
MNYIKFCFIIYLIVAINCGQDDKPAVHLIEGDTSSENLEEKPKVNLIVEEPSSENLEEKPKVNLIVEDTSSENLEEKPEVNLIVKDASSANLAYAPNGPINPAQNKLSAGEPRVVSYPAAGYSPSPYDALSIKKEITREESGKGVGNRMSVDVEIMKKDRKRAEIEDLDIYEIVDDSLQILSPQDDPRIALINFKKLNSLDDIGELKDILFRPGSYYSQDYESRNVVFPEGMEPYVAVVYPMTSYSGIKLNWDNISINGSNDSLSLLNLLKEDFNIKWADREISSISPIIYIYKNNIKNEVIYINSTKDEPDDKIWLQINGSIKERGTAELNISGQTQYNLTAENETENGNRRLLIYDWNPNLRLHVKDFSSRDRLFYWYYVKPKKSGSFNAETIVRIYDESMAGTPDIIYPMKVDVHEADLRFEVKPILGSSKVYANEWLGKLFGEKLKIEYIIKFIGDASPQYIKNVKVEMHNSTDKYHYEGKNVQWLDFRNKYNYYNINILYDKPGVYQIPSILIEGQHYDFDETITVDTLVQRNKEMISFFMAIIAFLLGLIFNKELKNGLKKRFKGKAKAEDKDTAARDEAAKKMADIIIEALERGAKEKR